MTLTLLSGCATAPSDPSVPPLVKYSVGFQQEAAKEYPAAGPHIRIMVTDYSKLRDAIRAIQ